MKEKLELMIAMPQQADNKLSKIHNHDIANCSIDESRAGLRNAVYSKIAEKNLDELATVLQTYNMASDQGVIRDLENLLSDIVADFSHEAEEA